MEKRKRTRLEEFDYSSHGAYFVTLCTKDRRCILGEIVGAAAPGGPQIRLNKTGEAVEKYIATASKKPGIAVEYCVIMPNHVHLLIFVTADAGPPGAAAPTKAAIPEAVRALKRLVNREVGQDIWQRGYHDHIIRNEKDYLTHWQYIDENPLKWADDEYFER